MSCPLCKPEKKTKWHYLNDKITILDCISCGIPMWIWNDHKTTLTKDEISYGRSKCHQLFGKNIKFREPRTVLDHYHEHVLKIKKGG